MKPNPAHNHKLKYGALLLALQTPLLISCGSGDSNDNDDGVSFPTGAIYVSKEGDVGENINKALIEAKSGDYIVLPKGTFKLNTTLTFDGDTDGDQLIARNITIAGYGREETVLDYADATVATDGIFIENAVGITLQDFSVNEAKNNAIKLKNSNGIHINRIGTVWAGEPDPGNGAYGLYPVECQNVLIENSYVRGSADAGVYVGQSRYIVVRNNTAEENVAGIEIENSMYADVYNNVATGNTGGILVFDLPIGNHNYGSGVRVFDNEVTDNNTDNFANQSSNPAGVHITPPGTGVIVLSTKDVEIFRNEIKNHDTLAVAIASFLIAESDLGVFLANYAQPGQAIADGWRPLPRNVHVHDNDVSDSGSNPRGYLIEDLIERYTGDGGSMPALIYDGAAEALFNTLGAETVEDSISEVPLAEDGSDNVCFQNNGDASVGQYLETSLDVVNGDALIEDPQEDLLNCSQAPLPIHAVIIGGDMHGCGIDDNHRNCGSGDPLSDEGDLGAGDDTDSENANLCTAGTASEVNWDALLSTNCNNLSNYRLFVDATNPKGAARSGGIPYDLNTQLFTDYSHKYRYIFVPPGGTATYSDQEVVDFPVGSVIVKTFALPATNAVDETSEELVETRLLIHREAGWVALPYVWNASKSDAVLTVAGKNIDKTITLDGTPTDFTYAVPSINNCKQCHQIADGGSSSAITPIGPKARHLNKDYDYGDTTENQLTHWVNEGWLEDVPGDLESIETVPVYTDANAADLDTMTDEELMDTAKGYLDINCSHCHRPEGNASNTGLFLEYWRPYGDGSAHGACRRPVAFGGGSLSYDVVPGNAAESIMRYRVQTTDAGDRMPPVGRGLAHAEGVELLEAWINSLPDATCTD